MAKFPQLSAGEKNEMTALIDRRWAQLYEVEKEWGEKAYKYLMLTNSGGAVAILTFLGTDNATNIPAAKIALVLFVLGVVLLGAAIARQYHHMEGLFKGYKHDAQEYFRGELEFSNVHERDRERYEPTRLLDYVLPYACFGCFVVGCLVGGWGLLGG
jgi:hypothetical protein